LSGHRTLQKIDSCLRAQRDLGTIKRLFKQSELVTQLDICETELKAVIKDFEACYLSSTVGRTANFGSKMQQGGNIASGLAQLNSDTERRHQELLELISTWSSSLDGVSVRILCMICSRTSLREISRSDGAHYMPGHFLQQIVAVN
jgi:hypothetical protein